MRKFCICDNKTGEVVIEIKANYYADIEDCAYFQVITGSEDRTIAIVNVKDYYISEVK